MQFTTWAPDPGHSFEVSQMNFLDWPVEQAILSERAQKRRRAIAVRLIERFASTYGAVEYDLFWESSIINAQAWRLGSRRRVTVYGGIVRHPAITASGIALLLAHETGHHLGGPPFDPDLRWPSWQGQADFWAASTGMPQVFGRQAARLTFRGAKQIAALHAEFSETDGVADISAEERSEIFLLGARGKCTPAFLQKSFNRMLEERDRPDE
jgi:hypothetical protein